MSKAYERIPVEDFKQRLSLYTELSSVALGAAVASVSDDFFAEASHLLQTEAAPSLKGGFGPNGALYSGWESRRHNPAFDWCIVKLGAPGHIHGFDVDTSHFNGNEAPAVSVQALFTASGDAPVELDPQWKEILPKVTLGPDSRHLFKIPQSDAYNYVKLNMYPDGGIARFRVYGLVNPVFPSDSFEAIDLAHVFSGGRVVFASDQHFGVGSNLLLPGRGKDMGDGWETKRSRVTAHKDWVIIRLGHAGWLEHAEIDTNHFKGNYPESCELHAINSTEDVPTSLEQDWTKILNRTKLGPHRRHFFQLENVDGKAFTHVKVIIHPDGGIKRVRVLGRRAETIPSSQAPSGNHVFPSNEQSGMVARTLPPKEQSRTRRPFVPVLRLTTEAFAPFGKVLMAWAETNAAPRGIKVTSANQMTAHKFHNVSLVESSYPEDKNARTGFSIYRSTPAGARMGEEWEVKLLERHPYNNQAFIPMGAGTGITEDELPHPARAYLVVVALSGDNGKPDLRTLRAFVASTSQGIVYDMGVWHHPMVTLEKAIDFTCVETQVGGGDELDCELVELDHEPGFPVLKLPRM